VLLLLTPLAQGVAVLAVLLLLLELLAQQEEQLLLLQLRVLEHLLLASIILEDHLQAVAVAVLVMVEQVKLT
jgi:hypothetical protein